MPGCKPLLIHIQVPGQPKISLLKCLMTTDLSDSATFLCVKKYISKPVKKILTLTLKLRCEIRTLETALHTMCYYFVSPAGWLSMPLLYNS